MTPPSPWRPCAKLSRWWGWMRSSRAWSRATIPPCTPELFSQGQWQLLSIARATAADPKLLLLDEITASRDVETEKEVLAALQRSKANRTVLSISHYVHGKLGRIVNIS